MSIVTRARCRHCHAGIPARRGLCQPCYRTPEIRRQYPRGDCGSPHHCRPDPLDYPLPTEPTNALPGSEDKLLVLERRRAQHVALFHPLDYCPDADADVPLLPADTEYTSRDDWKDWLRSIILRLVADEPIPPPEIARRLGLDPTLNHVRAVQAACRKLGLKRVKGGYVQPRKEQSLEPVS